MLFFLSFDISLSTNFIKVSKNLEIVNGMGHIEDVGYILKWVKQLPRKK